MPQMAPINWLLLFLIFSITLILFNILNYFIYPPIKPNSLSTNKKMKFTSLNWKW